MTTTTVRCAADQAKAGIDAMLCLVRSHARDRDPVRAIQDHLLEMRQALDNADA